MNNPEAFTPRMAGEQSRTDYTRHRLAAAAIVKTQDIIARSERDAADPDLDDGRRALSAYHVKWWSERRLPDLLDDLEDVNKIAIRHFHANEAEYFDAAFAEATLDGVEITRGKN